MNFAYCWHRPGRLLIGDIRACRHCGVSIAQCPCVSFDRNCTPGCKACEGSGWVGHLVSKRTALLQTVDLGPKNPAIERCEREIAAMLAQPPIVPAWLVTLGVEDWEAEKRLLLAGETPGFVRVGSRFSPSSL